MLKEEPNANTKDKIALILVRILVKQARPLIKAKLNTKVEEKKISDSSAQSNAGNECRYEALYLIATN